jgi:hypothetical protein
LSRCVGQLLNRYRALIGKLAVDNNSYDDIDAADDLSLKSIDDRLRLLRSANKQCVDELQSLKQDELDLLDWADGSTSDGVELVEHVLLLHSELQSITGQLCAKHPITEFWQDLLVTYNGGGNNESVSVNQTDAVRATAGISAVVNTLHSIEYKLSLLASDPSSPEICESVGLAMNILSNDWQNLQRSLLADGPTEETNECDQKRSIDPKQPLITFENANQKSDAADVEKTQINNIVEVVYESGETVEITAASDQPSVKLSRTERIALMKQRQREEEEIKRQREARIQLSQQILTELQSVIRLKPQTAAPS